MSDFKDLIGKKVVAFRGMPSLGRFSTKKVTALSYMLFDDGETFMEFNEQDRYEYHDCSSEARNLTIQKDKDRWEQMMNCDGYKEPDDLGSYPF